MVFLVVAVVRPFWLSKVVWASVCTERLGQSWLPSAVAALAPALVGLRELAYKSLSLQRLLETTVWLS